MTRPTTTVFVAAVCGVLLSVPSSAMAQEDSTEGPLLTSNGTLVAYVLRVPSGSLESTRRPRPTLLPVLYASYVGLQTYDGYSTSVGLARGAREANPLVQRMVQNPVAFWALKSSTTVGSIYVAERLWTHHHRLHAIALMMASNALMATVAAHNQSVLLARR